MALIPTPSVVTIGQTVTVPPAPDQPTKTYKVDFDTGRVAGYVDETEAMKQAIFKILSTERFLYLIYSWNYGIELNAVVGKSYPVFSSEIKRVITEALLADSRITDVTDFQVEQIDKRTARVSFTAETIFGEIPVERTVTTNV
jgi:hypothetical protein